MIIRPSSIPLLSIVILTLTALMAFPPVVHGTESRCENRAASRGETGTNLAITISIDRQEVEFPDQRPYVGDNGSIMVPLRFIASTFGAEVSYNPENQAVSISGEELTVLMFIGSRAAIVNDTGFRLANAPEISGGRVCVPLRFLAEILDYTVTWNQDAFTAELFGPLSEQPAPDSAEIPSQDSASLPDLGPNADLNGYRLFPADNPWNQPIDNLPVDPDSELILERMGLEKGLKADFGSNWNGGPFGIPYIVVDGSTPAVPMGFDYASESDPGPYPIPADAPVEKGSDRHILVLDRDNELLYETWNTWPEGEGFWAGSGAIFNLRSNALRPAYWTSADAAGLPILPGLVRYDEVMKEGRIDHALRVTVDETRHAFVAPATHFASDNEDPYLPPMGARIRLKSDYDITGFPPAVQVILEALKTYGMFVADNGASFYISGAPDSRWDDEELAAIREVTASDLEIVQMENVITSY